MIHSYLQKYLLWLHALRSAYKFVKQKTPEEQSLRLRYASLAPRASPAKFSLCHDDGSTFFPCKWYLAKSGKEEFFLFYSCNLFKGAKKLQLDDITKTCQVCPLILQHIATLRDNCSLRHECTNENAFQSLTPPLIHLLETHKKQLTQVNRSALDATNRPSDHIIWYVIEIGYSQQTIAAPLHPNVW